MPKIKRPVGRPRTVKSKRKLRPRPTPRWLSSPEAADEMAQRRCLLILSVLSGEKPVTEAILEAGLTRPHYYLLEKRALSAILRAVAPGSDSDGGDDSTSWASQVKTLEEKVQRLEREKRRTERLLLLTRKVLKPGPMKTTAGRPRKKARRKDWIAISSQAISTSKTSPELPSIPTTDGEDEP